MPESPQGQEKHSATDPSGLSHTGATMLDRRICDSPRQSMSDGGHSDQSALAEELNDVVGNELRRTSPIRANQIRRESWSSNQLSPTGTIFNCLTREPLNLHIPHTTSVPTPFPNTAVPAHQTHPPAQNLYPCYPTCRGRYDRKIIVQKNERTWEFEPLQTFAVHDVYSVGRWLPNIHPEGQLYFTGVREGSRFRYLTEENLYEQTNVDEMERFVEKFEEKAKTFEDKLSTDVDVFLSLYEYEQKGWFYYCVDSEKMCLFWIDKIDLTWMAEAVGTVPTAAHLKYGLDYEYWSHVEHFPFHQTVPDSLIHDLMGVAIHQSVDSMTSLNSTTPFSKEETQELVGLIKHLHTLKKSGLSKGYIVGAAARLMTIFVNERFCHFAGQHGAKLTKYQSIRGNDWKRTWLIRLISPILFYAPETHLTSLEKIYVDEMIKSHPWKSFVSRLEEDWAQYVLYSTVLLTADVSFLAVPNVMPNNGIPAGHAAPSAVVATQMSLIAAMGSIVIGLLLIREHKKKSTESAENAADFLKRRSHPSRGLEALAILYSLPFALLMWGMVSFLVGLGIICFVFGVNGLVPTILYAIVWGFVSVTILFTVLAQLEARLNMSWRNFPSKLVERLLFWKKPKEEEGGERAGHHSVTAATADSVPSRRTRIPMLLDFCSRRKENARDAHHALFDLGR